jgi:hypothetical protein
MYVVTCKDKRMLPGPTTTHILDNRKIALKPKNAPMPTATIVAPRLSWRATGPSQLLGRVSVKDVGGIVIPIEEHAAPYATDVLI